MNADSLYTFSINYNNPEINRLLSAMTDDASAYTQHFTQGEDFFLHLPHSYKVRQFMIHHSNREQKPDKMYVNALLHLLSELKELIPHIFAGLSWYFDPIDIFHPAFYSVHNFENNMYLYLLRLDLGFRPQHHTMTKRGSNDLTHEYETEYLFCEASFIPLAASTEDQSGNREFVIKNLISETWIGETGRGYRVKGIWMDDDLSKFFTRLFISPGKRLYPYFPFLCKYRTICENHIFFQPEDREKRAALLDNAIALIEPEIPAIQNTLRKNSFSEELEIFQSMKKNVDTALYAQWDNVIVESYLNSQGLREHLISERT